MQALELIYNNEPLLELSRRAFESLNAHPVVLVRNVKNFGVNEQIEFAKGGGKRPLLSWDFGEVMDLEVKEGSPNYLFSKEKVPLHWDGAFHTSPYALVFYCLKAPQMGHGGETQFCDTSLAFEAADSKTQTKWAGFSFSYKTEKLAHYGGKIEVPMVQPHPYSGKTVLRFAEPVQTDKNPVTISPLGSATDSDIYEVTRHLGHEKFNYFHKWQVGDLLVADNFRLIHGRRAFSKPSERHIRRVQVLKKEH